MVSRKRYPLQKLDEVVEAKLLLGTPSFVKARRGRGRKGVGLRYEAKIQTHFSAQYPHYVASPWFEYRLSNTPRRINYAQPDGLLIDLATGIITIIEVKYTHTADAYFQLYDKYLPVLEKFFGKTLWRYATVEVCRWFDSAIAFPTGVVMRESICSVRPGEFGVHVCRPEDI